MLKESDIYHGLVFARIIKEIQNLSYSIGRYSDSNSVYAIKNGPKCTGLYVKYSTKRLSPWQFTFLPSHQDEINQTKEIFGEVFIILVCGMNGIVALKFAELKEVLDQNHEVSEWVSVSRAKRQMFSVKGKDGDLRLKVAKSDFPRKILEYLSV